ncbi:MAG TPA: protein kinase [Vicinamibacterales bacterium]|nr:protein kinase [Vicinamibacterales bacterium]
MKLLGAGGMGVVYQAWDEALDLPVALKVIRPEAISEKTAAEEVERRFKRELVLARQVTHRNVVRIHDLGEIDGIKYISMPFLEGKDLATVLSETGRLPLPAALDIIRQVGEGLEAAHEAGVVHRDLKPENVMMTEDGRAVIMDFGISRPVSAATTLGLTAAGAVVGTIEYMAPEQALGQTVDQRADVYALGLIAYDVIAGRQRLATVTTPVTEMMQRLQHAPPPLRTKVPEVPEGIERIIARALEPDPVNRYQHVRELLADLDAVAHGERVGPRPAGPLTRLAIAAAALAVLLLVGVAGWWALKSRAPAVVAVPAPLSVVIADFENRAKEPLFEGALEQALGIGIEGASFIGAYPRSDALKAVQQFAPGQRLDVERARLLARREGIKVILAGSIEPAGAGYAIAVRALDAVSGTVLEEARSQASSKGDVLPKMAEVAADLRTELGDTTVVRGGAAGETFTAASLEAASEYSRAQDLAAAERHDRAIEHYRRATELDPNFGRAYSGWALSARKLGRADEAKALYSKALGLLDRMTEREKFRTLGLYYLNVDRNYVKSIENYEQLVQKYPGDGAGWNNLAIAYFRTRNFPKAHEAGAQALKLYPSKILYRNNYALYAMYAGDFRIAVEQAREVAAQEPSQVYAYLPIAMAALANGDAAGARGAYTAMGKAGQLGASLSAMGLGDVALYEGRFAEAERILRDGIAADAANKDAEGGARKHLALAEVHAAAGRTAEAIGAIEAALKLASDDPTRVSAGRLLLHLKRPSRAAEIAAALVKKIQPQSRAYGHLLEAELATDAGDYGGAFDELQNGKALADLWLGRFVSGVTYVKEGSYAVALSELEACEKRRGEATAIFLDDVPTWRYTVPVTYWLARAQEGVGMKQQAAGGYTRYLTLRQPASDPLAADAERRLTALR